ncbi:type 1 glutamine amidotransferase [Chitinophaga sp. sic0106]|uniref:type 1 glutamine amidotransferase n=1 Tax=Chitinophaga sp. sic0106 TaxID=2854785 RepID=UPI001C4702BF|nr:gamma-glutamyl-gamma-aminobutyrate hydrolase family protein [Chitinophaga sp. sic0106]MBV7531143.1 gamma-glutamyl-gamma-aminobutyrate hydrolase family protein [Chitinophaga sp. sic0106]
MHIHYFQHVSFEGLGCIAEWCRTQGHTLTATKWFEPDANADAAATADWLIIMGGPMGVYDQDQYPWLTTEINIVKTALEQKKKVLGICLGSQILAAALGANVYAHTQKEIGWYPVDFTFQEQAADLINVLPQHMDVFHYHGDTFDIPNGATRFAASAACNNQAFMYDNAIGLQFHIELTPTSLVAMIDHGQAEITAGGPFVQQRNHILANTPQLSVNNNALVNLLNYLAAK